MSISRWNRVKKVSVPRGSKPRSSGFQQRLRETYFRCLPILASQDSANVSRKLTGSVSEKTTYAKASRMFRVNQKVKESVKMG